MDDYILRASSNLEQKKPIVLKGNSTPTKWEKVWLNYQYRSYCFFVFHFRVN